ncbi:ion transporter [uncultured Rubinisphaera sp.]|uniref:ion transporter n=1 Tax=uncultured Rubinisphaera sp. TaxID=1678686 RepID=UPI0030D746E5|tara:strand:- start:577 stop:1434 length:858 start_codon:yes stop_codon:yes gene_type:complete
MNKLRRESLKPVIDFLDKIVQPLVCYSVFMLALECHFYPEADSHESHPFFLWSERGVALILTLEYLFRWIRNSGRGFYPLTTFGLIDLVAILPFWIGFVPGIKEHLQLIRTLRVLRMLKFFRYNRGLQVMALGFYRAYFNLRPLMLTAVMVILLTMFALYEIEGPEQEEFRDLLNIAWFLEVTGTTVGYGDLYPQSIPGRVIVMIFMIAGLAIFMACFSAITSAFDEVFEQANDPDFNPLEHFPKIRKQQERLEELTKDVGTTTADDEAAEEEMEEEKELEEVRS